MRRFFAAVAVCAPCVVAIGRKPMRLLVIEDDRCQPAEGVAAFNRIMAAAAPPVETDMPPHAITGVLEHADGPVLTLRTRTGTIARVDDSEALRRKQIGVLVPGYAYTVQGTYDPTGALHAQAVARAKDSAAIWPLDR